MEDYRLSASMNVLNVAQSVVIYAGMAAGLLVCTKASSLVGGGSCAGMPACLGERRELAALLLLQMGCWGPTAAAVLCRLGSLLLQGIADGSLTVGDAVLFVTLMSQLYGPLNFFGTCRWSPEQLLVCQL